MRNCKDIPANGGTHVKKVLFAALVAVCVLGFAATAFAATAPSVIDPATGASVWSYKDVRETTAKYEGGYAAFDNGAETTYTVNPHGGYNTTTNKCKVCHAVHRAEGAYYLLRADSQDDACSYCHVGSAHSTKVVYDLNGAGIYTMNGHTIGAGAAIPDSTKFQEAEPVVLKTADSAGNEVSATIEVRSYDAEKNEMYRFARHHGQSAAASWVTTSGTPVSTDGLYITSSARSGYIKVGPLALRCMSCHQPHNATNEVWRPRAFPDKVVSTYDTWSGTSSAANYGDKIPAGNFLSAGYKLLRRSPSASTLGTASTTGVDGAGAAVDAFWSPTQVVKAIEDTATKGTNFSGEVSGENTFTENGVTRRQPLWIAQDIHGSATGGGQYRYPNVVNQAAISWWCADCHNLNVGGWEPLEDEELGFKAHTERTHPAPYYGAYTGPGQCYSCHRNDLSVQVNKAQPYATSSVADTSTHFTAAITPGRESCTQCHYGTGDYYKERIDADVDSSNGLKPAFASDFPHSGRSSDMKLLGSYSVSGNPSGAWSPTYNEATITANTLDQVCLRCHPGIGFNH